MSQHSPHGSAASPAPTKNRRATRACLPCRRLKKTCEGNAEPCARCAASSNPEQCCYDKPLVTGDVEALLRLKSLEGSVHSQQEQVGLLVDRFQTMSSQLDKVLEWVGHLAHPNQQNGSNLTPSQLASPGAAGIASPATMLAHAAAASTPLNQSTNTLQPGPTFSITPLQQSASPIGGSFGGPNRVPTPSEGFPAPIRDKPGARMHIPIHALADTADFLKQHVPYDAHDVGHPGETGTAMGDQRPAKRVRLSASVGPGTPASLGAGTPMGDEGSPGMTPTSGFDVRESASPSKSSMYEFNDVVSKGIVTEKDARALVALWLRQLGCYCPLLDPVVDTFDSIRRRSPFLLAVIIHGAARAAKGRAPAPNMLIAVAEEVRQHAQTLVFEQPDIETAQAMVIMASWHDDPYILTGYAFRLTQSLDLHHAAHELDELGWDSPKGRPLIVKLRTWVVAAFIELRHSRSTGRPCLLQESDADWLERRVDRIFLSRYRIPNDVRMVGNMKLALIERRTIEVASRLTDVDTQIRYLIEMREVLANWHQHYDELISQDQPSPIAWSRAIHMRQLQDALIFLPVTLFHRDLFTLDASAQMQQLAKEVWLGAAETMHSLLLSPTYTASIRYAPHLLRCDLAFSGLLSLKLAQIHPDCITDEWLHDCGMVADLLGACSGSPRFAMTLKLLRDQILASRTTDTVTLLRPAALERLSSQSSSTAPQHPQITHTPSALAQSPAPSSVAASPSLMPSPKWTANSVSPFNPSSTNSSAAVRAPHHPPTAASVASASLAVAPSANGGAFPSFASVVGQVGTGELALLPGEVDDMEWFSGIDMGSGAGGAGAGPFAPSNSLAMNGLGAGVGGGKAHAAWQDLQKPIPLWGGNGTGGWGDPVMGLELEWMRGLIVEDEVAK